MFIVFWISFVILVYIYFGYPSLLLIFRREDAIKSASLSDDVLPRVTMIVSAYNEESVIAEKIENALAIDYPVNKLNIVVVSDCSDDATDEIVDSYQDNRIKLLRMGQRSGKSLGLNQAVNISDCEVLLFTDANAMFDRASLRLMADHFRDSNVGVVTGQQRYQSPLSELDTEAEPTQEGLYWRYESAIKELESANGNLVGGDGAIMAIRRELFFELAEDDLSDYLLPLKITMQGSRNVYEANAFCVEEAADSYAKEHSRKVRIVNRAWRATMKSASVLNPFKFGKLSLCVWSHKVLRWLTIIWMAMLAVATVLLFNEAVIYQIALYAQVAFYCLALAGWLGRERITSSLLTIPYYFCSVNLAAAQGILQHYQGKTYATWNTPRTTSQ